MSPVMPSSQRNNYAIREALTILFLFCFLFGASLVVTGLASPMVMVLMLLYSFVLLSILCIVTVHDMETAPTQDTLFPLGPDW